MIPIHDEHGELVAYVGRALDDEEPKYRFPGGFKNSQVLYQAGYPAVVALMGSTLSARQRAFLALSFDRVMLMLDGDAAGREDARTIAHTLTPCMEVTVMALEDGRQPDQLASEEIRQRLT